MSEKEKAELNALIAEHVMGIIPGGFFNPITDDSDAMAVLRKCYEKDRNSCLASFHNFLMRPDHDATFTPLQICLFAKLLFEK